MTGMIKITALTSEARRDLTKIQKEQFPFALAKTLNQVAWGGVKQVRTRTTNVFNIKTQFIPKGIVADARVPSMKRQIKSMGVGTAVVLTRPIISGFMPDHERGATRTATAAPSTRTSGGKDKGKMLALPARQPSRALHTASGKAKTRWHPRTLLADWQGPYKGGRTKYTKGGSGRRKAFIIISKTGQTLVVRRTSRKRDSLEIFWSFSKNASISKQWSFEPTVSKHVHGTFKNRLRLNFLNAVRLA